MSDNGPIRVGEDDVVIAALRREARSYLRVASQSREKIRQCRDEIQVANTQLLQAEAAQERIEQAIRKLKGVEQ